VESCDDGGRPPPPHPTREAEIRGIRKGDGNLEKKKKKKKKKKKNGAPYP
jgi:hypothetical protein